MAVGIRPLPVADADPEAGHIVMDAHLRSVMGLGKKDVIFAPIYYFHPEFFKGSVLMPPHMYIAPTMDLLIWVLIGWRKNTKCSFRVPQ